MNQLGICLILKRLTLIMDKIKGPFALLPHLLPHIFEWLNTMYIDL